MPLWLGRQPRPPQFQIGRHCDGFGAIAIETTSEPVHRAGKPSSRRHLGGSSDKLPAELRSGQVKEWRPATGLIEASHFHVLSSWSPRNSVRRTTLAWSVRGYCSTGNRLSFAGHESASTLKPSRSTTVISRRRTRMSPSNWSWPRMIVTVSLVAPMRLAISWWESFRLISQP